MYVFHWTRMYLPPSASAFKMDVILQKYVGEVNYYQHHRFPQILWYLDGVWD